MVDKANEMLQRKGEVETMIDENSIWTQDRGAGKERQLQLAQWLDILVHLIGEMLT